jgi:hypothetical protein
MEAWDFLPRWRITLSLVFSTATFKNCIVQCLVRVGYAAGVFSGRALF